MFDQINRLDEVTNGLACAHSLMGFLLDYFRQADPDPTLLAVRYSMYCDMACIIHDILHNEKIKAEEVVSELFKTWDAINANMKAVTA